ncbi:MAG TPA: ABC transporter permease, partial [bacterium]|nr:ABC transporter permease [bacterium]
MPAAIDVGVRPAPRASGQALMIAPALCLMLVFFVLPYLNLLLISFFTQSHQAPYARVLTVANYARLTGDPFTWGVVWRTLWLGAITTVISLVLSYPLAYHLARAPRRWKGLLMILVVSPLLVGVLIRTYGWI